MDAVERAERLAPDLKMVSDSGGRIADRIETLAQEGRKAQAQMSGLLDVWDERQAILRDLLARTDNVPVNFGAPASSASAPAQTVSPQSPPPELTAPERHLPGTAEEREVADLVSEALASIDAERQGLKPTVMIESETGNMKQGPVVTADAEPADRAHDFQDAVAAARSSWYAAPVDNSQAAASAAKEIQAKGIQDGTVQSEAARAEPELRAIASTEQDVVSPDSTGRRTGDDLLSFIRRRI
jgi:hypothetical protein